MGFRDSVSFLPCHPSYKALAFTLAGLTPAERVPPSLDAQPSGRLSRTGLSSGIMRFAHGTPWQPRVAGDRVLFPRYRLRKRHGFRPATCGASGAPPSLLTPRRSRAFRARPPSLGHVMLPGFPVMVRGNRQSHSRDLSPFGHRSSPEAPSLHRHYPASSVIRASPPPCRPNLSLAGCRLARATPPDRVSRVASIPLFHACCRQYPGGTCRCMRRSLPNRCQPSPLSGPGRLPHYAFRGLLGDSLRVTARMVAKPPLGGPLRRSASDDVVTSTIRSDCYRLERQLPGGIRTR